jgi:hypothetical protein
MKKNHEEKNNQALHWKYDAIEATFEWHEEGASGNLSNVCKKTPWSVRYARSMFVSRAERVCLVCPVALISMMI